MKKFFVMLAIAGSLVACNDNSETTHTGDSTAVPPADTTTIINNNTTVTTPADSVVVVDSMKVDTTSKK